MRRTNGVARKIGARVRAARQASGMTQLELSKRAGISKTSMNNLEMDLTHDPHVSVLVGIAVVLGTTVDALVGMDEVRRHDVLVRAPQEPMW